MQFVWLTVCSPILYCKTLNMICLFDSYGASVFILYRISCVSRLGKGKIIRPSSEEMKDADTALATWGRRGKQNTVIIEWFWSLSMKSTVARCLCLVPFIYYANKSWKAHGGFVSKIHWLNACVMKMEMTVTVVWLALVNCFATFFFDNRFATWSVRELLALAYLRWFEMSNDGRRLVIHPLGHLNERCLLISQYQ